MKKTFSLKSLLVSMAVASSAALSVAPATTHAGEVSYNATVSNFYFWRGQDISNGQGVLSGGADYADDSGLSVGMWTSSEDGGSEFDLYGGYGAEFSGVGINLSYAAYLYPSDAKGFDAAAGAFISEAIVGVSYMDLGVTAYINLDGSTGCCDGYQYVSVDYGMDKFGFHFGSTSATAAGSSYTDFNVSYAATDAFTITVSKAQGDAVKPKGEDPMINIAYGLPF